MKNNHPYGAEALLIALSTPNPKGGMGIPVILWGKPGVGKSSFIDSLASEQVKVLTLIASIHDPTDFSGLPIHHEGRVRYAIPEWVREFEDCQTGILFLDELSTAPPSVQAALLRVVLERKVGFHELPSKVRIVAAANPPDLMVGGWELSPPLRNRFIHLQWDIRTEQYIDALSSHWENASLLQIDTEAHRRLIPEWKLRITAFLKIAPEQLHSAADDDRFGFASPRTWDFAIHLLASCELLGLAPINGNEGSSVCIQLITGCLGDGVAIALLEFLKNLRLPPPEEILAGRAKLDIPALNDGELYVIFGSMNRVIENRLSHESLIPMSLNYFRLTEEVFEDGRRDLIYTALKKVAKAGLLVKVLAMSQRHSPTKSGEVTGAIQRLFQDEGLKEFIQILET